MQQITKRVAKSAEHDLIFKIEEDIICEEKTIFVHQKTLKQLHDYSKCYKQLAVPHT